MHGVTKPVDAIFCSAVEMILQKEVTTGFHYGSLETKVTERWEEVITCLLNVCWNVFVPPNSTKQHSNHLHMES